VSSDYPCFHALESAHGLIRYLLSILKFAVFENFWNTVDLLFFPLTVVWSVCIADRSQSYVFIPLTVYITLGAECWGLLYKLSWGYINLGCMLLSSPHYLSIGDSQPLGPASCKTREPASARAVVKWLKKSWFTSLEDCSHERSKDSYSSTHGFPMHPYPHLVHDISTPPSYSFSFP
jgi:hypothetical protein